VSVARPHWREREKESTSELTTDPGERERKRERNQQNRALSKREQRERKREKERERERERISRLSPNAVALQTFGETGKSADWLSQIQPSIRWRHRSTNIRPM
jgi:hypothetical protein